VKAKDISKEFGDPLPDWYLGVAENGRRFTVLVAHGFLQHPKVVSAMQRLRARLVAGETLSCEERKMARPLRGA
jgi:hypothetical protein